MRKLSAGTLTLVLVGLLAGCGGSGTYANKPRPPAPVTITAAIRSNGVVISPARIGAGPITLLATNDTGSSQDLTVAQDSTGATAASASTGPINPQGVGQVKVDVVRGHYTIKASGGGIVPAKLAVGKARPSAQNDLLQP